MFKFKSILVLALAVCASSAWAQLMPKSEVSVGYTYSSMDQNLSFGSTGHLNSNGWNTGGTFFMNNYLGLEANIAGVSGDVSGQLGLAGGSVSEKHYTFVFGPRVQFGHGGINPYVHGLFGLDRETLSMSVTGFSTSASGNAFATALGGGVEFGLAKHLGLTTGADYLLTRHGLPGSLATLVGTSGTATQNNFRVSAGLSFRFGSGWGGSKF